MANKNSLANTAAANTAVTITVTGVAAVRKTIEMVAWSYDQNPTTGRLLIESPVNTTKFDVDITVGGPGGFRWGGEGVYGTLGEDIKVTLAAGGSGVVGKLNVTESDV